MKLAFCVAPMELGGLGDGFTINMSRLAALPRFSASFSTMLSRFYLGRDDHRVEGLPHERLIKLLKTYGGFC